MARQFRPRLTRNVTRIASLSLAKKPFHPRLTWNPPTRMPVPRLTWNRLEEPGDGQAFDPTADLGSQD